MTDAHRTSEKEVEEDLALGGGSRRMRDDESAYGMGSTSGWGWFVFPVIAILLALKVLGYVS